MLSQKTLLLVHKLQADKPLYDELRAAAERSTAARDVDNKAFRAVLDRFIAGDDSATAEVRRVLKEGTQGSHLRDEAQARFDAFESDRHELRYDVIKSFLEDIGVYEEPFSVMVRRGSWHRKEWAAEDGDKHMKAV